MKSNILIGRLIKNARKAKGLNQDDLALLMNCKRQYVSKLERGINLSLESLDKVLDALNLDLNAYTSEKEKTPNKQ